MLFLLAKFWCFLQAAGGCGAPRSLGAQYPAPFLFLCLRGLEVGLCHQGKLFWIEANVAILVVLEVNFAHKHQNQSNILLTVTWCSAAGKTYPSLVPVCIRAACTVFRLSVHQQCRPLLLATFLWLLFLFVQLTI